MARRPSHPPKRPKLALLLSAALLIAAASARHEAGAQSLEYPIKAAFLFKFGEFVQWPPDAFQNSGGVLNICIVGDNSFAGIVGAAVQKETVAGRKVAAHDLSTITSKDSCHIAYIAGSSEQRVEEALRATTGSPVLTVTDESRAPSSGIIHFVIRNNRVRFAIDDSAAAASGLTLSSALLNIAVSVQRRN